MPRSRSIGWLAVGVLLVALVVAAVWARLELDARRAAVVQDEGKLAADRARLERLIQTHERLQRDPHCQESLLRQEGRVRPGDEVLRFPAPAPARGVPPPGAC